MSITCGRRGRLILCVLTLAACSAAALNWVEREAGASKSVRNGGRAAASRAQGEERVDIRLRSFAPNASGQLTLEASAEGGRGRLTALSLPDPRSQSRDARTYVVWASSEGRIVRLGELRTDRRGNGGLSFRHPGFDRYTVIVTAEPSADAERPLGAPVLSTRAGEAAAIFPAPVTQPTPAPTAEAGRPPGGRDFKSLIPLKKSRGRYAREGFYGEVEGALDANSGGRVIDLEGAELAPRARGSARAAAHQGRAYVVVRFSDVPLPNVVGARTYVMWALIPDGRIVYMGSLPVDDTLNRGTTYVRVPGFDSGQFDLFVTAEQARPVPFPSERRALSTRNALNTTR